MKSQPYPILPYSKVRTSLRAHYDKDIVHGILDVGLVAHVAMVMDGRPIVIPMAYARIDETVYIHGAKAARLIKKSEEHLPVCLSVTHIDGLVAARSAFHHSVNYRSVVAHGSLRRVNDDAEKAAALIAVTNHLLPGRWDEVRPMTDKELKATGVLAIEIETASAKIRTGPPKDEGADYELPVWAGVLPINQTFQPAINDPRLTPNILPPASLELASQKFASHN